MKHRSFWEIAVAMLALTAMAVETPRYLVTDGSNSPLAQRAESELQLFWKQIFGQELEKVAEGRQPSGPTVYLGDTAPARQAAAGKPQFGEEEWLLQTVGNDLVVAGGKPAGTLYAVYALLEHLGVAFLAPDETTVPPAPTPFPTLQERRQPTFVGRLIYDSIASVLNHTHADQSARDEYALWLLRNRINGEQSSHVKTFYTSRFYKLTTRLKYHSFCCYVPLSLFAEHPEYFGMDEFGVRQRPKGLAREGTICMSNPDVVRVTLESLRGFIQRDRKNLPPEEWPYIYDISQLDNSPGFCRCPECAKITEEEGSQTGLLLHYINSVAREIRKEYPDVVIRTFGYSGSRTPPKKTMPESNVLIQLTDRFTVSDPFHPLSWAQNSEMSDYFNGWGKAGVPMMLWDYWNLGGNNYYNPPRIETIINSLQEDFKYFHKLNIKALFLEASTDHVSPQNFMMLNYYVANHLMVDVNQDVPQLERQFIDGYYGPAAPTVRKWYDKIKEGVLNDPQRPNSAVVQLWSFTTPDFVAGMRSEFQAEMAKLPAGSRYIRRLQDELISPLFVAVSGWAGFRKAFEPAGVTRDILLEECRKYSYDYTHRFPYTGTNAKFKKANEEYGVKRFEEKMGKLLEAPKVPERFANVPSEDLRSINYRNFRGVSKLGAKVVDDPDALEGKALCSANPKDEMHGVNLLLPKTVNGFRTTEFVLGNHKASGKVKLNLKKVPQDEQYHWFRIPGSVELKPLSFFWGHGWAIQARTSHWFVLTDGNPLDNTWTQVWFRGKFTGPAYVPGSTQKNAIWIDTVVATRNQPDPQFQPLDMNTSFTETDAKRLWHPNTFFKNTGSCQVIDQEGKKALQITTVDTAVTAIQGPIVECAPDDWLMVKVKASGAPCEIGFYFFKEKGFHGRAFQKVPDNGLENTLVFDVSEVKKAEEITRCRLVIQCPGKSGVTTVEKLSAFVARKLNQFD